MCTAVPGSATGSNKPADKLKIIAARSKRLRRFLECAWCWLAYLKAMFQECLLPFAACFFWVSKWDGMPRGRASFRVSFNLWVQTVCQDSVESLDARSSSLPIVTVRMKTFHKPWTLRRQLISYEHHCIIIVVPWKCSGLAIATIVLAFYFHRKHDQITMLILYGHCPLSVLDASFCSFAWGVVVKERRLGHCCSNEQSIFPSRMQ